MPEIWLETSKNSFWQKTDFEKIIEFSLLKLRKCKNRKIDTFAFLAISPTISKLHRRTVPHSNSLNNSFWPYGEQFCSKVNSFRAMIQNVCLLFFTHPLNNQKLIIETDSKKTGLAQKFTISKKSTVLALSSWDSVKRITSWGSYFHQVSSG